MLFMDLAYRKYGEGQPLLILHGLFGQSDNWSTLAKRFAAAGYEVYTIDQRNHGLSPHSEVWNYESMAADLDEFIRNHHLTKPILIGHSMGGKTAMFFALNYPDILYRLIIADIAPRSYAAHHEAVLAALHAVDFTKIHTRKEAESAMEQWLPDYGTRQFLLKNIYWEDAGSNKMNWRFNLKTISEKYENIGVEAPANTTTIKTLFMRGERSNYIEDSDLIDIERRFPDYELITISDAGHWIHAEKPEEFYQAVMNFITT